MQRQDWGAEPSLSMMVHMPGEAQRILGACVLAYDRSSTMVPRSASMLGLERDFHEDHVAKLMASVKAALYFCIALINWFPGE